MLTPPAVRFIRIFDAQNLRMMNVWMSLSTQEQIDNAPVATELTTTAKTVKEALVEIRKMVHANKHDCWPEETIAEIEKASTRLVPAQPSFYGTLDEFKHA